MRRPTPTYLVVVVALSVAFGVTSAGCKKGPKTPDEAFLRLERAIAAGDARGFYDCLDRSTQKAIESTWRDQQLERTIIEAKYPESEAGPALAKLAAASADSPRAYFEKVAKERRIVEAYRKRLGSVSGPVAHKPDGEQKMWLARQDGLPFHFSRNSDGTWGFGELGVEWALEQDRASHAVKTVRDNAALYEKAGH
jgi:hypothetical protein